MTIEIHKSGSMSITGDSVSFYRMLTLLNGLKFEMNSGMKLTRGRTCYARIKSEYGLKGSKQRVYDQFKQIVDAESAKQERIHEPDEQSKE